MRIKLFEIAMIADLHYILQSAMGRTVSHLHQFTIYGKRSGLPNWVVFSLANTPSMVAPRSL